MLNSPRAVEIGIYVVCALVQLPELLSSPSDYACIPGEFIVSVRPRRIDENACFSLYGLIDPSFLAQQAAFIIAQLGDSSFRSCSS